MAVARSALALCAVMLAAGCGAQHATKPAESAQSDAPPPPSATAGTERFGGTNLSGAAAKAFIGTLQASLASGDEKQFLSLFDPGNAALQEQQRTWFANVRRAPLSLRSFHLVAATDEIDSSAQGRLAANLAFEHQFAHADPGPVAEWYSYTFHSVGGRLVATKVTGAPAAGVRGRKYSRYYRQAWDDGPMAVAEGRHVVLLGPAADAASLRAAVPVADRAIEQDFATFARPEQPVPAALRHQRWVLELASPRVHDLFDYFGGQANPTEANFAGVTTPVYHSDTDTGFLQTTHPAVTSRVALARELVPSMAQPDGEFASVVRHEIAHAITTAWVHDSETQQPQTWVVEGLAQWVADRGAPLSSSQRAEAVRALGPGAVLPDGENFYQGDDATVAGHYAAAHAAVLHLVTAQGVPSAFRVLRQLYTDTLGLTSFSRAVGVNQEQFARQVRKSLHE